MLVRFLAAVLLGWAILEISLYWIISDHNHTPMKVFPCIMKSLPAFVGILMLIKAKALAEWISSLLDD